MPYLQSGLGKWATVKEHNDNFQWNEGVCPIFLRSKSDGKYAWINPNPGGSEYLRPLVKSSTKDTAKAVLAAVRQFEAERDALVPLAVSVANKRVTIEYTVQPSMHDGANIKVMEHCSVHCQLSLRWSAGN